MSEATSSPPLPMQWAQSVFKLFSSIGLALIILAFLLLLTWLGTEKQPEVGLFAVQQEYFNSWILFHTFEAPLLGSITLPLPGVMLLLVIFFLNLLCGGIVMLRKSFRTIGVFIAHFSMIFLLAGGLLQHRYADDGYLQLYEGEKSNEFVSYHDWVIQVHTVKDGEADFDTKSVVIPPEYLKDFDEAQEKRVETEHLPFDLRLYNYALNGAVMPAAFHRQDEYDVVDGMFLRKLEPELEAEANASAFYVDALTKDGEVISRGILWGYESQPMTIEHEGKQWLLKLDRKRWKMPFEIQLDKFTYSFHPGTGVAREYKSDVTKIDDESEKIVIEMNEPLRHEGYTLFQANWGPQENGMPVAGEPYSVFAVWRNPTNPFFIVPVEHWPLVTMTLAALGMSIHFIIKLAAHISRVSTRPPNTA